MVESADLWVGTLRKETMDLLIVLWRSLNEDGRIKLSNALLAGPPESLFGHIDESDRESSRDRRMFDRLVVLERVGQPPLTPPLAKALLQLRRKYPEWRSQEGERAHFSSWFETRWGPETRISTGEMVAMKNEELAEVLVKDRSSRDGLMESWRLFAASQPERAFEILESLAKVDDPVPPDIWESSLQGLREARNTESIITGLLSLLAQVPDTIFNHRDVVRAAADLLEAKSRNLGEISDPEAFWRLFDRATEAASAELVASHIDEIKVSDWVHEAINSSLGRIATAFVNALFARRPHVGEGLGVHFRPRGDRLMLPKARSHRFARIVGASRISYLHAIDPDWSVETLIPCFAWSDEEEAIAMWQGYAWQARIDPQLWMAIQPYFLGVFDRQRLERIGSWATNLAQLLMVIGVEFGEGEFKREDVRNALRSMSPNLRADAAAWIAQYVRGDGAEDQDLDEGQAERGADWRWHERAWPWIRRVWPLEAEVQSADVSRNFALAIISTNQAFSQAIRAALPYSMPSSDSSLPHALKLSPHPDSDPSATLAFLDAFVAWDETMVFEGDLREVIDRVGANLLGVQDARYRRWHARVHGG